MSSYIQNYGYSKTLIQDNKHHNLHNVVEWVGDYDGRTANVNIETDNNGNKEFVSMTLNNNDIRKLFGIQPIEMSLDKRLTNDFLSTKPIVLEGALIKRKSRKHKKKYYKKKKSKRSH